jgi:TonB-dependent receptor
MSKTIISLCALVLITLFFNRTVLAAGITISGHVEDAETNNALPGANVILLGTSMGAATDVSGNYVIQNVPSGTYNIKVSYIGYKSEELKVTIKAAESLQQDFSLRPVSVEGKTVLVTAQASGQQQAINQQLSSNQIVNAVSSARIQALPDQNAAESVGRLPGISVLRNGGEGTEVVIRGLAPKYNNITIDGVQIASSNPDDRSTDLSGISSNMLQDIKVYKTVTPDMDANVIGGTVDFDLREAKTGSPGIPHFGLLLQGGYKSLSDAYNKFNNYKYVGSAEERFLNDRLGIFAQIDIERENLSSNELGASYDHKGNSLTQYVTTGLTLSDVPRDIQRRNGALVIDYRLPNGKIKLTNFLSSGLSNDISRQENFAISGSGNSISFTLGNYASKGNSVINGLEFQNDFSIFQVDAKVSNTYSDTRDPHDWAIEFDQASGTGLNQFNNVSNINPIEIPKAATFDFSNTLLSLLSSTNYFSKADALTGSLDLSTNLNFSDFVNAQIKFGGKYRYQTRYYNEDVYDGGGLQYGGAQVVNDLIAKWFNLPSNLNYKIPITYFVDKNFGYGKFLGGDYQMVEPLNYGMLATMATLLQDSVQYIANNHGTQAYGHDVLESVTNDYSGHEEQGAFYLMSILNIGSNITLIPGVRYQSLRTDYKGPRGIETRSAVSTYNYYDTTISQTHGYFLPDVSLKYKPYSWFDVRLSYTNTLAYPDYSAIIPRIDVGVGAIDWNNYKLVPSRSTNYDADLSFYDNTLGLFTVGGFWKNISNLVYPWTFYVSGSNALQYYPPGSVGSSPPSGTFEISTTINDSSVIHDYGIELDWQTHFWYLPGILTGLVLNVNYSHIFSKAQYPYLEVSSNGRTVNYTDTTFADRLLYQPDNIFNLSLGFDYKDFSIRVSLLYQDNIFTGPNFWPQLRSYTSAYSRWDLAFKQGLPWYEIILYGDVNNLNSANDVSVIQGGGVPESEQSYGLTAQLGFRWNFN